MKFNNQDKFQGNRITNVIDRPILHKKGKQWIIVSLSTLLLAGLGTITTINNSVHANSITNTNNHLTQQSNTKANTINNNTTKTIANSAIQMHKQLLAKNASYQTLGNKANNTDNTRDSQINNTELSNKPQKIQNKYQSASSNNLSKNTNTIYKSVNQDKLSEQPQIKDTRQGQNQITSQSTPSDNHWIYSNGKYINTMPSIDNISDNTFEGLTYKYDKTLQALEFTKGSIAIPNAEHFINNFQQNTDIKSIKFDNGTQSNQVTNMNHMFSSDNNINIIIIPKTFDTRTSTSLNNMFSNDNNLKYVDFNGIIGSASNMQNMFANDINLQMVNITNMAKTVNNVPNNQGNSDNDNNSDQLPINSGNNTPIAPQPSPSINISQPSNQANMFLNDNLQQINIGQSDTHFNNDAQIHGEWFKISNYTYGITTGNTGFNPKAIVLQNNQSNTGDYRRIQDVTDMIVYKNTKGQDISEFNSKGTTNLSAKQAIDLNKPTNYTITSDTDNQRYNSNGIIIVTVKPITATLRLHFHDIYGNIDGITPPSDVIVTGKPNDTYMISPNILKTTSGSQQVYTFVNSDGSIANRTNNISNNNKTFKYSQGNQTVDIAPVDDGLIYKFNANTHSLEFTRGTAQQNLNDFMTNCLPTYYGTLSVGFSDYVRTIKLDSDIDTSHTTNMSKMFSTYDYINSLILPKNFDTSRVKNMSHMFVPPHFNHINSITINSYKTRFNYTSNIPTMYKEFTKKDKSGNNYTSSLPNNFSQGNIGTYTKTKNFEPMSDIINIIRINNNNKTTSQKVTGYLNKVISLKLLNIPDGYYINKIIDETNGNIVPNINDLTCNNHTYNIYVKGYSIKGYVLATLIYKEQSDGQQGFNYDELKKLRIPINTNVGTPYFISPIPYEKNGYDDNNTPQPIQTTNLNYIRMNSQYKYLQYDDYTPPVRCRFIYTTPATHIDIIYADISSDASLDPHVKDTGIYSDYTQGNNKQIKYNGKYYPVVGYQHLSHLGAYGATVNLTPWNSNTGKAVLRPPIGFHFVNNNNLMPLDNTSPHLVEPHIKVSLTGRPIHITLFMNKSNNTINSFSHNTKIINHINHPTEINQSQNTNPVKVNSQKVSNPIVIQPTIPKNRIITNHVKTSINPLITRIKHNNKLVPKLINKNHNSKRIQQIYVYNPTTIILYNKHHKIIINKHKNFTGKIIQVTKYHNKKAYIIKWHHKNYMVNTNQVQNAYIQPKEFKQHAYGIIKHITVKLLRNAQIYNSIHFTRKHHKANIKAETKVLIIGIKSFGKQSSHRTRLILSNGLIITANKNYVKIIK